MNGIFLATESDAEDVSVLRREVYTREFTGLDNTKILWSSDDEHAIVLIARNQEGNAVATMRAQFAWTLSEAEDAAESSFDQCALEWPAMVLERAATRLDHRGLGLNSALRFHFITIACEWSVPTLLGGLVSGASRTRSMREMGYRFIPNRREWRDVRTHRVTEGVVLDVKANGRQALDYLMRVAGDCIAKYPWAGVRPQRPW